MAKHDVQAERTYVKVEKDIFDRLTEEEEKRKKDEEFKKSNLKRMQ